MSCMFSSRTPSGVMATWYSSTLISVGTPTVSGAGAARPPVALAHGDISRMASTRAARMTETISSNWSGPATNGGESWITGSP